MGEIPLPANWGCHFLSVIASIRFLHKIVCCNCEMPIGPDTFFLKFCGALSPLRSTALIHFDDKMICNYDGKGQLLLSWKFLHLTPKKNKAHKLIFYSNNILNELSYSLDLIDCNWVWLKLVFNRHSTYRYSFANLQVTTVVLQVILIMADAT